MTVDIYIAPAVAELTAHLSRLPAGEKNVVFCEDRLTLEAERAVARAQGVAFDTRVTTFARFIGEKGGRTLSKQGSVLAVAAIAAGERSNSIAALLQSVLPALEREREAAIRRSSAVLRTLLLCLAAAELVLLFAALYAPILTLFASVL